MFKHIYLGECYALYVCLYFIFTFINLFIRKELNNDLRRRCMQTRSVLHISYILYMKLRLIKF